jgi:predicted HNH restriction endonuclease
MSNIEFEALMNGDDFAQLCFNCHKAVHWCMEYLGFDWEKIKSLVTE